MNRRSWGKVSRVEAELAGRKIIPCQWVFKIKQELNNTVIYKSRLCVKGFHQVPEVYYTESFSPVANMSIISILLLTTLFMEDHGWICKMFDVEAAFLNAELETSMFLKWLRLMRELGFITEGEERDKCIKLVRSMYGNVDTTLRW